MKTKERWNRTLSRWWQPVGLIIQRELTEQARDWRVVVPMLSFGLVFPFFLSFMARQMVEFAERQGMVISSERVALFLLLTIGFFPVAMALPIAFEAFAGEKERGSLETLLHAPVSDAQLFLAKLTSAVLPALASSCLGIGVYLISLTQSQVTMPAPALLLQITGLTLLQSVVMTGAAVLISTQATSVRAANLTSAVIIVPFGVLVQGESLVIVWGDPAVLPWISFGMIALGVLFIRIALVHFQREEMLNRDLDRLDWRGAGRIFLRALAGDARTPWEWYFRTVPGAVRRLGPPVVVTGLLMLFGGWLGMREVGEMPAFVPVTGSRQDFLNGLTQSLQAWPLFSLPPVIAVWWQNVRVVFLSFLLGTFSFGVFGILPTLFSVGVTGFLMGTLARYGIPIWAYLSGFILPHGVLELSAAAVGVAGILRMGATLATPTPGKSFGEVWLLAFADWVKVMAGVVIPLLFVAAAIEVWFTPRLALWLFHEYNMFGLP